MLELFKQHINQELPFLKECKLLIAISGGIDSVVLAHLCKVININFALAHCNFNLRGNESDADEDFVSKFGAAEQPLVRLALQGSGYSNSFRILTNDTNAPYTINGLYVDYIPSGRR